MSLTPEGGHRLHTCSLLDGSQITTAQAAESVGFSPRQIRQLRGTLREADRVVRGRAPMRASASIDPGGSTSPAGS